ncbi:MAG: hypothetical protein JSW52_00085 [Candidatus Coatesbacteria bacterium]|nr:MAG: hypothetical protein JSW52_00085 [Candidatus Coatesbacteria bacterium]
MSRGTYIIIAVFFFLSVVNQTFAELVDRKYVFLVGGGLGLHSPANNELGGLYRDGFHYYVKGGFGIASHFSLVGEYGETWYRVVLEYKGDDTRTYKFRYLSAGARYNFVSGAYVIPYAEGLAGMAYVRHADYMTERESAVRNDFFPIAIGTFGSEFFIGPNWCIEGSIELYHVFGDVYLQPQLESEPEKSPLGRNIRPTGFQLRGGFIVFL